MFLKLNYKYSIVFIIWFALNADIVTKIFGFTEETVIDPSNLMKTYI